MRYQLPDGNTIIAEPDFIATNYPDATVVVEAVAFAPNPTQWLIDVGPFLDRFGASKLPALMSTEPIVAACVKDMMARKWIDLQRAEVAAVLSYMAGVAVPGLGTIATPITGMTSAKVTTMLTTPVASAENSVLKKLYF